MLISINNYLCLDIDECAIKADNCNAYQICNNTEGSFTCICKNGSNGNNLTGNYNIYRCFKSARQQILPVVMQNE